jgi:beta-carotene ketolase (CrtW type)
MPARDRSLQGFAIALGVLGAWAGHLGWLLAAGPAWPSAWMAPHVALQAYLCTGLFITAHDAMHGAVSAHPGLNRAVGSLASFLFAGLSYRRLVVNHQAHHAGPTGKADPDFFARSQAFWPWLGTFMVRYTTVGQLLIMAAAYNLLERALHVPEWRLWAYWVAPTLLGTLQLFYFGTYLPHRPPHRPEQAPHFARTQSRGHLWAMLSCYFFGYHREHHESPGTPWWRLWRLKEARARAERPG